VSSATFFEFYIQRGKQHIKNNEIEKAWLYLRVAYNLI